MKAAELLKPRFEILADFPGNHFGKVGTILDRDWDRYPNDDETEKPIWRISDFPHLFKKLDWWEYRKEEEMPKKVKSLAFEDAEPDTIVRWDMKNLFGFTDLEARKGCSLDCWAPGFGYIPVD